MSRRLDKIQEITFNSARAAEEGNKKEWLFLFDENAILEDPIGKSPLNPLGKGHSGIKSIEKFWDDIIGPASISFRIRESYPCGEECANVATITNTLKDGLKVETNLVIIYKVNKKNKITSLRSYWDFNKTLSNTLT